MKCCKTCDNWESWRDYMGDDDPLEPDDCGKCHAFNDKASADDDVCDEWKPKRDKSTAKYIVSYRDANGYAVIDTVTGKDVKCWMSEKDAAALAEKLNRKPTALVVKDKGE